MAQPKLDIAKDFQDQVLEWVALGLLTISILLTIYYYPQLNDTIPTHFNGKGEADGFGSKAIIWVLGGLSLFTYLTLTYLSRLPHYFNYPVKITEENAKDHYKNALKMTRYLKVFILLSFLYFIWVSIQNGLGHQMNLGTWFTPVFLVIIFSITLWPLFKNRKLNNN